MAKNDLEIWKNVVRSTLGVVKYDRFGNFTQELVAPGGHISLSTEERLINMERAADPSMDFFKNGWLSPVRVLETAEDYEEIASNPNLMGESEIKDLLKAHWKTFEARLKDVTNAQLIERMIEMSDDANASAKHLKLLEARLEELRPSLEPKEEGLDPLLPNPVTPR